MTGSRPFCRFAPARTVPSQGCVSGQPLNRVAGDDVDTARGFQPPVRCFLIGDVPGRVPASTRKAPRWDGVNDLAGAPAQTLPRRRMSGGCGWLSHNRPHLALTIGGNCTRAGQRRRGDEDDAG